MTRNILSLEREKIKPFTLDAIRREATELNQRLQNTYTTPFPKAEYRWISHYWFKPNPIEFTKDGEVVGGLSFLACSLFDFSFVRSVAAKEYSKEGGHCFDPASLFVLELCKVLDTFPNYAKFCEILHQPKDGESYRALAGLRKAIPDEVDLHNFRSHIGEKTIQELIRVFVQFFTKFGLIDGNILVTDGQLQPTFSRYKGCAFACSSCHRLPLPSLKEILLPQIQAGKKELKMLCPFEKVQQKVKELTEKKGKKPKEVSLTVLEIAYLSEDFTVRPRRDQPKSPFKDQRQELANLLGVCVDELPAVRIRRSRIKRNEKGEIEGIDCPKAPSDLEARVGYHIDNSSPDKVERVFGYNAIRTTNINCALKLELPVGGGTYPADIKEGEKFPSHLKKISQAVPNKDFQIHGMDSGYDQKEDYECLRNQRAIPVIAYNPRRENLTQQAQIKRGYDSNGVPFAPCGRIMRSNGYHYDHKYRQFICGKSCQDGEEEVSCEHLSKRYGFTAQMSACQHPRLVGEILRGSKRWEELYAKRTAAERTNSYDQEVIGKNGRMRFRGLRAFAYQNAIRLLGQLLRKAFHFILDVTYTLTERRMIFEFY